MFLVAKLHYYYSKYLSVCLYLFICLVKIVILHDDLLNNQLCWCVRFLSGSGGTLPENIYKLSLDL